MKTTSIVRGILAAVILPGLAMAALVPATHPLFDGDAVHEIHLTFAQSDWWTQLTDNYENYDDIPYIEAEFDWDSTHFDAIGVRFKGNSSYTYNGDKKSFKLDIDEFVAGQELAGLDKLSLNNCYLDPTFVREKCAYELCEAVGLPTVRTNYAELYINGSYWGLYLLIEQYDQEFIESRFGSGEGGNLWKGEPYGSLEYLGAAESLYYDDYELKTNEEENDWSGLVRLVDKVNNTPISVLPDSLHNLVDVNSALAMLAIENFTVDLDSYIGRCANYYFYQRDLDDRFVFAKWDQNESWGIYDQWHLTTTEKQQLSPYWTSTTYGDERPLAEQLWQVDGYDDLYCGHMQRLMAGAAQPDVLVARMEELRDLIRTSVYADPNMMFTTAQFEASMTSEVYAAGGPPPGRSIPALETFIRNRHSYLTGVLGTWTPIDGLVLNEIMASNNNTLADENGDYDDWIEVANVSDASIDLGGLGLTDHMEGTPDFVFPTMTLAPGECVLVWADEEPGEGDLHTPFKLDGDGEDIYLTDGAVIIDEVTYPALGSDVSWGRWPHGTGAWSMLSVATPGATNENPVEPETVVLVINEILALNTAGIMDENDQYEDWVEIYNPGVESVAMGGLFLTDDPALTTQWAFADTVIEAGGHLVVWCDKDPEDGPLHAACKLSGDGETVALFGRLAAGNDLIDSYTFGVQVSDVSEGRETDGAATWTTFETPTPGASNAGVVDVPDAAVSPLRLLPNVPNPFNPQTRLRFDLPADGYTRLEIYDARGRLVDRLVDESMTAGRHDIIWDGRNTRGAAVSSGTYFSRLSSGGAISSGQLTLIR